MVGGFHCLRSDNEFKAESLNCWLWHKRPAVVKILQIFVSRCLKRVCLRTAEKRCTEVPWGSIFCIVKPIERKRSATSCYFWSRLNHLLFSTICMYEIKVRFSWLLTKWLWGWCVCSNLTHLWPTYKEKLGNMSLHYFLWLWTFGSQMQKTLFCYSCSCF